MNVKLVILIFVVITFAFVNAEFYFNHILPTSEHLTELDLKCIPGRTTIRIQDKVELNVDGSDEYDDAESRRSHMNTETTDEFCKICVCSLEGKDEYCSKRPAMNVNECIHIAMITEDFKKNIPFDYTRNLAYRIRRVGSDSATCIPYVSEYTDCTEENRCSGCQKCTCTEDSKWTCQAVTDCEGTYENVIIDNNSFEDALTKMKQELKIKQMEEAADSNTPLVPRPSNRGNDNDLLLGNYLI
ncbi:uncharacterized protein ACR2FA_009393 [Aphomia sociella]